jgi:Group II intron, maturase-specific domain
VLIRINQITRGWANYFKHAIAQRNFSQLQHYAWSRIARMIRRRHRWKPKDVRRWLTDQPAGGALSARTDHTVQPRNDPHQPVWATGATRSSPWIPLPEPTHGRNHGEPVAVKHAQRVRRAAWKRTSSNTVARATHRYGCQELKPTGTPTTLPRHGTTLLVANDSPPPPPPAATFPPSARASVAVTPAAVSHLDLAVRGFQAVLLRHPPQERRALILIAWIDRNVCRPGQRHAPYGFHARCPEATHVHSCLRVCTSRRLG